MPDQFVGNRVGRLVAEVDVDDGHIEVIAGGPAISGFKVRMTSMVPPSVFPFEHFCAARQSRDRAARRFHHLRWEGSQYFAQYVLRELLRGVTGNELF